MLQGATAAFEARSWVAIAVSHRAMHTPLLVRPCARSTEQKLQRRMQLLLFLRQSAAARSEDVHRRVEIQACKPF